LTGDQKHTDHIATGHRVNQQSSRLDVFYFSPPHFLKNNCRHTLHALPKPRESTLYPKLCQRVQSFQGTKKNTYLINVIELMKKMNER
jgi:hypothetical protein